MLSRTSCSWDPKLRRYSLELVHMYLRAFCTTIDPRLGSLCPTLAISIQAAGTFSPATKSRRGDVEIADSVQDRSYAGAARQGSGSPERPVDPWLPRLLDGVDGFDDPNPGERVRRLTIAIAVADERRLGQRQAGIRQRRNSPTGSSGLQEFTPARKLKCRCEASRELRRWLAICWATTKPKA